MKTIKIILLVVGLILILASTVTMAYDLKLAMCFANGVLVIYFFILWTG